MILRDALSGGEEELIPKRDRERQVFQTEGHGKHRQVYTGGHKLSGDTGI